MVPPTNQTRNSISPICCPVMKNLAAAYSSANRNPMIVFSTRNLAINMPHTSFQYSHPSTGRGIYGHACTCHGMKNQDSHTSTHDQWVRCDNPCHCNWCMSTQNLCRMSFCNCILESSGLCPTWNGELLGFFYQSCSYNTILWDKCQAFFQQVHTASWNSSVKTGSRFWVSTAKAMSLYWSWHHPHTFSRMYARYIASS